MRTEGLPLNKQAKAQGFNARFVCLESQPRADERCPLCLQLTHNRQVRRYSIKEAIPPALWDKDLSRVRARSKGGAQINGLLNTIEARVIGIVDALLVAEALSLETFDIRYRSHRSTEDVAAYLLQWESVLRGQDRISYARTYRNAASALRRYSRGKPIRFAELTSNRLDGFVSFLHAQGCTAGGISTYLRVIRAAFNRAIKSGLAHRDLFPFETHQTAGFSLRRLKTRSNPRALSEVDFSKLLAFPYDQHPELAESASYFLLSYFLRGANFRDLAHLKRVSLYDGRINYSRRKTGAQISIPVNEAMTPLLARLSTHEGEYLFPILSQRHKTEQQRWDRIQKRLRQVNRDLRSIKELLGITTPLTFYVARHCYASQLKRKGVSVALISQGLGHGDIRTTEAYLGRFGNEALDATDKLLLPL